jgi:hypothetical protein
MIAALLICFGYAVLVWLVCSSATRTATSWATFSRSI